jgi:hypothetical protein
VLEFHQKKSLRSTRANPFPEQLFQLDPDLDDSECCEPTAIQVQSPDTTGQPRAMEMLRPEATWLRECSRQREQRLLSHKCILDVGLPSSIACSASILAAKYQTLFVHCPVKLTPPRVPSRVTKT